MIIGLYSSVPQSGKTTARDTFVGHGFIPLSLADPVKRSLLVVLNSLYTIDADRYLWGDWKNKIIPEMGVTGGRLMSNYAMGMRDLDPDVWLNCLLMHVDLNKNYVVDDLRFHNEFDAFDININIVRPFAEQDHGREDRSEGILVERQFDYKIINNSTIEHLQEKIECVVEIIMECQYGK